jgi:hypothetical protein
MKKLMTLFGFLVLLIVPVIAQDTIPAPQPGEVPVIPDLNYLVANFAVLMLTVTGIAAIASFVAEFLIRVLKATKKMVKIVLVFVLGVGLSFLAKLLGFGDYAIMVWYELCLWGLLSGAAAAGLRGTNFLFLKSVVEFVIGLIVSKEPKE